MSSLHGRIETVKARRERQERNQQHAQDVRDEDAGSLAELCESAREVASLATSSRLAQDVTIGRNDVRTRRLLFGGHYQHIVGINKLATGWSIIKDAFAPSGQIVYDGVLLDSLGKLHCYHSEYIRDPDGIIPVFDYTVVDHSTTYSYNMFPDGWGNNSHGKLNGGHNARRQANIVHNALAAFVLDKIPGV